MALENGYKFQTALDLVKTGLQSGSIKLIGTGASNYATRNGEGDATYLITLIEGLVKQLPDAS